MRDRMAGVGHNYVFDGVGANETKRGARIAVQNTGQTQAVHFHREGERCNEKCYTLTVENIAEEGL